MMPIIMMRMIMVWLFELRTKHNETNSTKIKYKTQRDKIQVYLWRIKHVLYKGFLGVRALLSIALFQLGGIGETYIYNIITTIISFIDWQLSFNVPVPWDIISSFQYLNTFFSSSKFYIWKWQLPWISLHWNISSVNILILLLEFSCLSVRSSVPIFYMHHTNMHHKNIPHIYLHPAYMHHV